MKFTMFWNKKKRHKSSISEVIDSERRAYLNTKLGFFLKNFWQWTCSLVPKTPEIFGKVLLPFFFIILFFHYFLSDLRFYCCSITRWLETTSILVVIERIYSYQFKSNYLRNHKSFPVLWLNFWNLPEILNVLKK